MPLAGLAERPDHLAALVAWLRSYRPEELFDTGGLPVDAVRALAPGGDRRMGADLHGNGGRLLRDLVLPDHRARAVDVPAR